jgi:hypothetical protein
VDNDGDGRTDYPADLGCSSATDSDERPSAVTSSGVVRPFNTGLPVITGVARVGRTLTSSTGSWANGPTGYRRQWRRCDLAGMSCVDIAGATGWSYVLGSADVGRTIRVTVWATNAAGSTSVVSAQTAAVTGSGRYWWRRSSFTPM